MNAIDALNMMDPKEAMFGFFFAFSNRLQAVADNIYEGVTCKQFFLMACMSLFQEEPPTANDLARVMGCTRQNVKEILTSLEKKGLVLLVPHKTDKRKRIVMLTEKAQQMSELYKERDEAFLKALYEGVSEEEIRGTYLFLAKLEDNLINLTEEIKV